MRKKIIDFSKYSSIKIGDRIEVFVIEKIEDLSDEFYIIGGANNLLISPSPPPLAILSKKFDYIKIEDNKLFVGGATPGGKVLSFAKRYNIKNFEFLNSLPGTIGGMVKMNAGVKEYEIFNFLYAVKTKRGYIKKEDISYGYRYTDIEDVVFEAVFEIEKGFSKELLFKLKSFRKNQPKEPSAGSCFKNPSQDYAGRLIEAVGLKGYRINDAAFSEIHANFLVNLGKASFNDALNLIKLAEKRVYERFNIKLEREVIVL